MSSFGPPSVLVPSEVPTPVRGPGQVLVEVTGAGVGPWDAKLRRGDYGPRAFPYIPGNEISGIVSATGHDTQMRVGDTVFGTMSNMVGGYAEYTAIDSTLVTVVPSGLDLEAMGAAPVGGATALEGLDDHLHLSAGETLLVAGAAGGVGSFVVQIGKARGARVVGTASPDHHDFVRSLGADDVVDYQGDWVSVVHGVDAAFDCVGGDTWSGCIRAVRDGGRAVSIAAFDRLDGQDRVAVSAFSVAATADRLADVAALIADGSITVRISERLPLDEAARAHEIIETGHVQGKLILIPG